MALDVRTIYAVIAGAPAGNAAGCGFNPYNSNFPTDLATTNGTSATPQVSGAYAFTAADATAQPWVYIASGTNWIQGFYQLTSQSGGVATLNAAIGAAVIWDATTGVWKPSTVQGCCTQDTPGGNATYGVDYSQSTSAYQTTSDLDSDAATPSVLSGGTGITYGTNLRGNLIHLNGGTSITQGWYEIVTNDATTMTLDRNCGAGTTNDIVAQIGGAASLNSATANRTDDIFFELGSGTNGTGASIFFLKGALTLATGVGISAAGGTQAPVKIIGYNNVRGDAPTGTSRPSIAVAAVGFTLGASWDVYDVIFTLTTSTGLTLGTNGKAINCKAINSSTLTNRAAISPGSDHYIFNCEGVSYRGNGFTVAAQGATVACYAHDSDVGIKDSGTATVTAYSFNISESNVTASIQFSGARVARSSVINNTLFGALNTTGTGVLIATGSTDIAFRFNLSLIIPGHPFWE